MFRKKKETNVLNVMYYEGLNGFLQDMPCNITFDETEIIIKKINPEVNVRLPIKQIIAIDAMQESNFMAQYHNTTGTTSKMGTKFYYVFKYTSSTGELKHIAFWDVSAKTMKQILKYREIILNQSSPSEYVL